MNLKTTFTAANVVLDVVARKLKKQNGVAVFLRSKTGKAKAVLGCRSIQPTEEAAKAEYDRLVAESTAKGWTLQSARVGSSGAGRFTEVPAAPTAPVEEPAAPARAPKAEGGKKAANGKK